MPPRIVSYRKGESLVLPSAASANGAVQYEIQQIRPAEGIPAGGVVPGSSISFRFRPAGTKFWSPANSWIEFNVRTVCAGTNIDPATNAAGSAPLVPGTLLKGCSLALGSTTIEAMNDLVCQASAYLFRSSEMEEQEREGPLIGWGPATFAAAADAALPASQPLSERVAENVQTQTRTYMYRPPLGVFHGDYELPPGEYVLSLDTDAAFKTRALMSSNTATATALATAATARAGTSSAYVELISATFHAALIDYADDAKLSGSFAIPMTSVKLSRNTLVAESSDLLVKVPPTSVRHACFLQGGAALTGVENDNHTPAVFAPSAAAGAVMKTGKAPAPTGTGSSDALYSITSLQLIYAGHASTTPAMRIAYNTENDTLIRLYQQWAQASGLTRPQSYASWKAMGPIASFAGTNVRDVTASAETDLRVLIDRESAAEGEVLIVASEYEHTLICEIQGGVTVDAEVVLR